MRIERMGERAVIVRDLPVPAYEVARALEGIFQEAVPSYDTLGIYLYDLYDPSVQLDLLETTIRTALETAAGSGAPPKAHRIPVCYEMGEDLHSLSLPAEEVIALHTSASLTCYAVGFCPGFAYLGYLPETLADGRLPSPRTRVEPGSVGIAARQTAVYTLPTPGGWRLIGRTPLTLVDVADDYFPIAAGDTVSFFRIDEAEFSRLRGERL